MLLESTHMQPQANAKTKHQTNGWNPPFDRPHATPLTRTSNEEVGLLCDPFASHPPPSHARASPRWDFYGALTPFPRPLLLYAC